MPKTLGKDEQTVVIVDDDPDQLELLEAVVRSAGYAVYTALNCKDCLELMKTRLVDVVVCDIVMPDMGGMEFVRHIRELSAVPEDTEVPIILVTADRDDLQYDAVLQGADTFCLKKDVRNLLVRQIEFVLERTARKAASA